MKLIIRKKKIIFLFAMGTIFILGIISFFGSKTKSDFILEKAQHRTITEIVSETGHVHVYGRADIYSETDGFIDEVYVTNNDRVSIKQPLFKVRSAATEVEKATAYAQYQSAINNLKLAEQNKQTLDAQMWQAHKLLLDSRNTANYRNDHKINPETGKDYTELEKSSIDSATVQTEKNFKASEKKVLEADAAITAAKALVNSTWLAYKNTQSSVKYAPTDGTVTNLSSFMEDYVRNATIAETPVLTIANLEKTSIKILLNEVDIPKIAEGNSAQVTFDAFSNQTFDGKVVSIDNLGSNIAGVIRYNLYIDIINSNNKIKPGMTANVDIIVNEIKDVLSVSNNAIKPYKGGKAVRKYNINKKEVEYVPVKTGIKGEEFTQITEGLKPDDEIIISLPNNQLKRPGLF